MANGSQGRKKSNFPAQTSVLAGASLDFFVSSVNYKITYDNFVAGLGVTGSIVQEGNALATPILDIQGSVNGIRNLEDGSGIQTAVSPENGVTIEHNFIEDTSGVELIVDLTADQPKFRSLVAGSGISVGASNGSIQIALSGVPATTKTVIVNQLSDFPTAVAGVMGAR